MVISLNSFLDTNVLIGYIFSCDSLFKHSKEYIFKSKSNYYSQHVKTEMKKIYSRKNLEFEDFFLKLYFEIEQYDDMYFLSKSKIVKMIYGLDTIGKLNQRDMELSFDKIWEFFEFGENQEVMMIKLKFGDYISQFESLHNLRKNFIFKTLNLVPNHTKKDKSILDKIKKENLRDELLHAYDEDILFDANEFCKNNKDLKLIFVSADQNFIKAIDILMEYLCFDDCVNLIEFSNN